VARAASLRLIRHEFEPRQYLNEGTMTGWSPISREFPSPLTDDKVQAADVVITMGCGDACSRSRCWKRTARR
jgi:hypothetical protein